MSEELQEVIQQIRDNSGIISSANEMVIRQGVVLPILKALGWNVWNATEDVIPEYAVGPNRVDYCLASRGQGKVFIEAKSAREDLDAHREQLLKYAFQSGVPLAVLTSGIRWSFYVPMRPGASWQKRCFLDVDLFKESLAEVDRKLQTFLTRSSVLSGTANAEANKIYDMTQKADAIEQALPEAWNKIIQQPDELLVELLIETVENICHHRPERKTVEDFVLRLQSFSTQQSDEAKRIATEVKPQVRTKGVNSFPVSAPQAFIKWGALSVKSQYRVFLPANQEGLNPKDRTYFTVRFIGYGDTQAYMSQGRLKIKDKNIWREIVAKLGIRADDTFLVKIIKPSLCYEVGKE